MFDSSRANQFFAFVGWVMTIPTSLIYLNIFTLKLEEQFIRFIDFTLVWLALNKEYN